MLLLVFNTIGVKTRQIPPQIQSVCREGRRGRAVLVGHAVLLRGGGGCGLWRGGLGEGPGQGR